MRYAQPYGVSDTDASYINGNPAAGIQGSIPPAEAFENPQRELVGVIAKSGYAPSAADLLQLTQAVRSQKLNYAVDSGTVNAMHVVFDPPFLVLTPGLPLRIKALFSNTGATTLQVDGVATHPVVRCNGAALAADDILASEVVDLVFDGTNFQITNFRGVTSTTTNNNTTIIDIPYVADTSAVANVLTAIFSPAITSVVAGKLIEVKVLHANTGASTINVNALAARGIKNMDGSDLIANQLVIGMVALLVFDGTNYQLVNPAIQRQIGSGVVTIAKRTVYQDPNYHITTAGEAVFVEAFRVTHVPVGAGNRLMVQFTGGLNSGPGNQYAAKRNISAFVAYSIDGGASWNPPSFPGDDFPVVGSFQANSALSTWESGSGIITQRDECFTILGQVIVPAGPPAGILFRLMYAIRSAITPDAMIHGGTMVHIVEYTG